MAIARPISGLPPPSGAGYGHPGYAASLAAFGKPRLLARSRGWILERVIPNSPYHDAMGCYPLFACDDWSGLAADLEACAGDLVTVTLVADPFGKYTLKDLLRGFDFVRNFKRRYVMNFARRHPGIPTPHHRVRARRALRSIDVEIHRAGGTFLDEWVDLYRHLTVRHAIFGIPAFSREAFQAQLSIPGLVLFRARLRGQTVGMHLWYVRGDAAYSHLSALHPAGYKVGAAFALHDTALRYFGARLQWLDFGGGSGAGTGEEDGLCAFKQGWANGRQPSLLCGRILNPSVYEELQRKAPSGSLYFPTYREDEYSKTFGSPAKPPARPVESPAWP